MRLFRRSDASNAPRLDTEKDYELGLQHFRATVAASDPLLDDRGQSLLEAIRRFQFAGSGGDRRSVELLAACYLVPASIATLASTPIDGALRFAGYAATVMGRLPEQADPDSALVQWFRRIRARVRGSVFVPRDVEYAFGGSDALAIAALDPRSFGNLVRTLDATLTDARNAASLSRVLADPECASWPLDKKQARARKTAGQIRQLPWKMEDVESLRAIAREDAAVASCPDTSVSEFGANGKI